jgi:alpha-galactosidase
MLKPVWCVAALAVLLAAVLSVGTVEALNNGLGRTPQMGWNSWNWFGCNINETLIHQTIDTLIASGLATAGYRYVVQSSPPRASFSSSAPQFRSLPRLLHIP